MISAPFRCKIETLTYFSVLPAFQAGLPTVSEYFIPRYKRYKNILYRNPWLFIKCTGITGCFFFSINREIWPFIWYTCIPVLTVYRYGRYERYERYTGMNGIPPAGNPSPALVRRMVLQKRRHLIIKFLL